MGWDLGSANLSSSAARETAKAMPTEISSTSRQRTLPPLGLRLGLASVFPSETRSALGLAILSLLEREMASG